MSGLSVVSFVCKIKSQAHTVLFQAERGRANYVRCVVEVLSRCQPHITQTVPSILSVEPSTMTSVSPSGLSEHGESDNSWKTSSVISERLDPVSTSA